MKLTKKGIERIEQYRGSIMKGIMDVYSLEVLDMICRLIQISDNLDDHYKWPDDMEFDEEGVAVSAELHEAVLVLLKSYHMTETDLISEFARLFEGLEKRYGFKPKDFIQAIREELI